MAYLEKGEIYNPIEERIFRKTVLPLAHLTNGRLATGQAREILEELDDKIEHTSDPGERAMRQCIRDHTLALGSSIALVSSNFHNDATFVRDAVDACLFADSPKLTSAVLDMFAEVQDPRTGYTPTSRLAFSRGGLTCKDESTFKYLFLAWFASKEQGITLSEDQQKAAIRAANYTVWKLDADGFNWNESTRRSYWADELILPTNDVISYTTGWGAIAMQAAFRLEYIRDKYRVERAIGSLQKIADQYHDRLPLSLLTGWIDVTAPEPDVISFLFFGKKLIDDSTVRNTLSSFRSDGGRDGVLPDTGLRVILDREERFLTDNHFIHPDITDQFMDQPGSYQNGATWHDKDYVAWADAKIHGIDLSFLPGHMRTVFSEEAILGRIQATNFGEFEPTGRLVGDPDPDPRRSGHIWNARVYAVKRKLENSYGVPKPFQEFIKNL